MGRRSVECRVGTQRLIEGGRVPVLRPFPTADLEMFDPFLLLDHMGPVELDEALDTPAQLHCGFETVTYVLSGHVEHRDSTGNVAHLGPGDVQWVTAGSGLVHPELPEANLQSAGGTVSGFRLWVNLPRSLKSIPPRYQELRTRVTSTDDGLVKVRVIAGEALGAVACIETRTPVFLLHFTLEPGAKHAQPAPPEFNTLAYVFQGALRADEQLQVAAGDGVIFARDGDCIELCNDGDERSEVLLLGGVPLREPVARDGSFVMNTRDELLRARDEHRSGELVRLSAQGVEPLERSS